MDNQQNFFDFGNIRENRNVLDELFYATLNYRTSKEYLELIKFINRFPSLSPFNAFLIYMQNPGVSIVLSQKKWAKYRRKVKPYVRPLVILVPFGPVQFVYDIADTEGEPVPESLINPYYTEGEFSETVLIRTIENCVEQNIKVFRENIRKDTAGFARNENNNFSITLNNSYESSTKYSTLVHELGHIFCGHLGSTKKHWWESRIIDDERVVEFEAESISHLVCSRINLKTSSHEYLSNYLKGNEMVPKISLDLILTITNYIEQMGKAGFRPRKIKE